MSTTAEPLNVHRNAPWMKTNQANSGFVARGRRSSVTKDAQVFGKAISLKPHRICGVCGDRARSLHFGGLSCDSCKAFFRRAVQSGTYRNFQCPHQPGGWNKFCVITVASRKSCQKCRFEACVQIGMEISWVMSEAERQRLLITRMAKKRKPDEESQCSTPSSSTSEPTSPVLLNKSRPHQDYLWPLYPDNICLENFMSQNEALSVEKVKLAWTSAIQHVPPTRLEGRDLNNMNFDHAELVRAINGSIRRFQAFASPLFVDTDVADEDKKTILKSCMLDLCILRAALNHFRGAILLERLFPSNLHEVHIRFVRSLQELSLDQTTMLLFLVVILLSPDRPVLQQPKKVEKLQEYYLMILYKYMVGRYGTPKASALYPKLLSKMADIQELSDCHQEQYLSLAHHEVQSVKEELSRIQCSECPPPSYEVSTAASYPNQQLHLSSFDQTFAPVSPTGQQQYMSPSSQSYYSQTSPMSDPSSEVGYMPYDEKQGFFFDSVSECGQPNNFIPDYQNNTLQQGQCYNVLSRGADCPLPIPTQPAVQLCGKTASAVHRGVQ
ncbi:thyroid hormone receptor beta-A-like isoform X2 [Neocloeon triangulifer]|uniref:thyroid hormone receptor beta-A-like isoform X2 n=1 Tax=Neocloeon triangulifer TaxID=2078957 RepID=UPI00286ECAE9|nr:thyroid hormone receptor beta-A-like isoform X2 [Neocloeon triangulifer]